MTIYRIEIAHALAWHYPEGPYQNSPDSSNPSCHYIHLMWEEHRNQYTHPVGSRDGIGYYRPCACPSFDLLKRWFAGYTGHLANCGFKCYAIKLPRKAVVISRSGKQCSFDPNAVLSKTRVSFVTAKPI